VTKTDVMEIAKAARAALDIFLAKLEPENTGDKRSRVPWRFGFVRGGVIDRTFKGRRYRISTGRKTLEAALAEHRKFELDPAG
jgi:hypothetical protein